jgi:hypothetical protein
VKLPSARCLSLGGLTALLACSTPISFEPQVEEEEEEDASFDAGSSSPPVDAGRDARIDASADARVPTVDAAIPMRDGGFACDVYNRAANCPALAPTLNAACMLMPSTVGCFYQSSTPGALTVANCLQSPPSAFWSITTVTCSYRCSDELPQGSNFFSLLTDDCARRSVTKCQRDDLHTSQQSVDRMLSDAREACAVSGEISLGITFNALGCPDWLYYTAGRRLPNRQSACLSERLEALRVDCAPRCALVDGVVQ